MLAIRAARRNSYAPSTRQPPLPDPHSEFVCRVTVTHPGSEAGDTTLAFDATPCDRRPLQDVECVTIEARASSCEDDEDRLVRHAPMLVARE